LLEEVDMAANEAQDAERPEKEVEIEDLEAGDDQLEALSGGGGGNESIIPDEDYTSGGTIRRTRLGGGLNFKGS
jgi:hypothetical protein